MAACWNPHQTVQEKADGSHPWIYCSEAEAHREAVGTVESAAGFLLAGVIFVVALVVSQTLGKNRMSNRHQEVSGRIRPFKRFDRTLGKTISVSVSPRYTTLTIGDRHYYFDRKTGACDGTSISWGLDA